MRFTRAGLKRRQRGGRTKVAYRLESFNQKEAQQP